jgi:hypothetical protein
VKEYKKYHWISGFLVPIEMELKVMEVVHIAIIILLTLIIVNLKKALKSNWKKEFLFFPKKIKLLIT